MNESDNNYLNISLSPGEPSVQGPKGSAKLLEGPQVGAAEPCLSSEDVTF